MLAKCLEFLGWETKQIPFSGCSTDLLSTKKIVREIVTQPGFEKYKVFLEDTLKPEVNKTYIYGIFAYTGKTLEVFKALLNHPKVQLGSKTDRFVGINSKFLKNNIDNNSKEFQEFVRYFHSMLDPRNFHPYSEVRFFPFYKKLENLDQALTPEKTIQNKLMKFCMLDIIIM